MMKESLGEVIGFFVFFLFFYFKLFNVHILSLWITTPLGRMTLLLGYVSDILYISQIHTDS